MPEVRGISECFRAGGGTRAGGQVGKQNDRDLNDVAADFFGDDIDWLDDDNDELAPAAAESTSTEPTATVSTATEPIAAEPASTGPASTAPAPDGWESLEVEESPEEFELEPAPIELDEAPDDEVVDERPRIDITPPPAERYVFTPEPAAPRRAEPPAPRAEATRTPPPAQVRLTPSPVAARTLPARPRLTPAPAPPRLLRRPPVPARSLAPDLDPVPPSAEASAWVEAADLLVAEAAERGGEAGAELLFHAGEIHRTRTGDAPRALHHLREARQRGCRDPHLFRALVELARREADHDELLELLDARAASLEGAARADVLVEAAVFARDVQGRADLANKRVRAALEADPSSFSALTLLRDLLHDEEAADEELAVVLDRIAGASSGFVAAEAYVEQARALRAIGDHDEARAALEAALDQWPAHAGAFDALAALLADRGDHAGLAALYEAETARQDASERGGWKLLAARAHAAAGELEAARAAFAAAAADGWEVARRELQATLLQAGDAPGASLALQVEVEATTGIERSHACYRLGWHLQHAEGDIEGAVSAYREAAALDPAARPPRDALWDLQGPGADVPEGGTVERLRKAERLDEADPAAAGRAWGALFELESTDLPGEVLRRVAWYGRMRCAVRLQHWSVVAACCLARADEVGGAARLPWIRAAALVGPPADPEAALRGLGEVLALEPTDPQALIWFDALCDEPSEQLDILVQAAEATDDPVERGALLYRIARLRADLGEHDAARDAAALCLDTVGHFAPALDLLVECSRPGAHRADALRRRAVAEARDHAAAWDLYAAALHAGLADAPDLARELLRGVLEREPGHAGALAELERLCLEHGELAELAALYDDALDGAPSAAQARLALRLAELAHALDRRDEATRVLADLALQDVDDRPLRAAARLAVRLGAHELASRLLEPLSSVEDRLERARIIAYDLRQPRAALVHLQALFASSPDDMAVALHTARVALLADERDLSIDAHAAVARALGACPARAAYAAWTAGLLEAADRRDEALEHWLVALDARADGLEAFERAVRGLARAGRVDDLRDLFARHAPERRFELARALEIAGDELAAAAVLAECSDLPSALVRERLLQRHERWHELYEAISARRELTRVPAHRRAADARRRWLLVEKLADSEAAWDLYRSLHEEDPDDVEVTEALARIASARGEVALALHYLEALSARVTEPADKARWHCRIGETHERAGDFGAARQAFLDALDHVPDDPDALEGLARLAREESDWQGLIAVLQREAGLAGPSRQLELRRDIARITEEHLGDPQVAMDAWRAVLELSSDDEEALVRLLGLAENQEAWAEFVEIGTVLANRWEGAERGALLGRMGIVCLDVLGRDDGVVILEQAILGARPDVAAARRLEALHVSRLDWDGAIRALEAQSRADLPVDERVEALLRAAHIEIEGRHDKQGAAVQHGRVLELAPDHESSLRFMATHLYESGRFDDALPVFERLEPLLLAEQDLDDFDTRIELSMLWSAWADVLRRYDEARALAVYERCLELNPTHLASLEAAGPLYVASGQWKKAERVYRQLLQLMGGHGDKRRLADAYTQLGLVERALGQDDKALKRFNKALELHQNHIGALKGMAQVLEDREDWNNVLNIYNNVIYHATVPQDVIDAYMAKGRILDTRMQRPDKAAQHYERTLEFDPDQPFAHLRLAELALRQEAWADAARHARSGLVLRGERADAARPGLLLCGVAAHRALGAHDEAESWWRELQQLEFPVAIELPSTGSADPEALRRVVELHLLA